MRAAVGQAFLRANVRTSRVERDVDIREAASYAVETALENLGSGLPTFALVFTPFAMHDSSMQEVQRAINAQLKNIPVFGFSTAAQFTGDGIRERMITVALLAGQSTGMAGEALGVRSGWWPMDASTPIHPHSAERGELVRVVSRMMEDLGIPASPANGLLLLACDAAEDGLSLHRHLPPAGAAAGANAEPAEHIRSTSSEFRPYVLAGCLAGSSARNTRSTQFGGTLAGEGGLAAAWLTGAVAGVGEAHGWQPVGFYFRVTSAEGSWVRTLDGAPAAEVYGQVFGNGPKAWTYPPLNELIRLYPLGIETEGESDGGSVFTLCSPVRVEADGSLLMSSSIPTGSIAHILVSNAQAALEAAGQATRQAVKALGVGRPVLAIVFADLGWKLLFDASPENELSAIRAVLGPDVPIVGGYTLGQITHQGGQPVLLNQHMMVVVIGERSLG